MTQKQAGLSDDWPNTLNPAVLDVIKNKLGFTKMTPVQSAVVPIFANQHKDVVVEAVTGSGKTLAFVIPLIEILLRRKQEYKKVHNIGALVISPTRELAVQIYDVIVTFTDTLNLFKPILFVGGNKIDEDMRSFLTDGGNIVVCTPGRFEDLLNQKSINMLAHLKTLEVLVLDEADRLLDLGFSMSLLNIIKHLPKQRRTGLFSATQTDEVEKLIKVGLRNPCTIQVKQKGNANAQKTPLALHNYYQNVEPEKKFYNLISYLKSHQSMKIICFMSTCAGVEYFSKLVRLFIQDTKCLSIHRKVKSKRTRVYNEFKSLKKGILICTDLLARGIDIEDVDCVIQYDAPKLASTFVHRCGRTARLGRQGDALIYLLPNEDSYVQFLALNQNVPLSEFDNQKIKNKESFEKMLNKIRALALSDRDLYEKGIQAFVSYIKAYSKHECSHLFKVKELDFVGLAKGYGLLHMPKMPEIKKSDTVSIKFIQDLDTSKIPYK